MVDQKNRMRWEDTDKTGEVSESVDTRVPCMKAVLADPAVREPCFPKQLDLSE